MKMKVLLFFIVAFLSIGVYATDFNVKDFGAVGDGKTDCTEAFQKALDAAAPSFGTVFADGGNYLFKGHLNVPNGVTLKGTFDGALSHNGIRDKGFPLPTDGGTCFLVTENEGVEEGPAFITLNTSSTLKGVVIYYPNQKPDKIPVPYPWSIAMRGKNPNVFQVELLNSYNGIDATQNERHIVRDVTGQPLRRGIFADAIYDIGRWENIHFNPWFSMTDPLWNWQLENGEAFIIGRSDWHYLTNCFCYGYKVGYKFIMTNAGACNAQLLGIGADGCNKSVLVEACNSIGLMFVNAELVAMFGKDPVMLEISENCKDGVIMFQNSVFWGPCKTNVIQKAGSLTLQGCNFAEWDFKGEGNSSINVLGGDTIIDACRFQQKKNVLNIEKARGVIFTGNMVSKEDSIIGKENTVFKESNNIYNYK